MKDFNWHAIPLIQTLTLVINLKVNAIESTSMFLSLVVFLGWKISKSWHTFLKREYYVIIFLYINFFCQILIENWFLEENVVTFMSIGYTFRSSLAKKCQLNQILFRDACHPGSIMELKKKTNLVTFILTNLHMTKHYYLFTSLTIVLCTCVNITLLI